VRRRLIKNRGTSFFRPPEKGMFEALPVDISKRIDKKEVPVSS